MKKIHVLVVLFVIVSFASAGMLNAAGSGKFPEKPVTLVVQAGAGGGSDIFARTMSSSIEANKLLPRPLVVENKPGGGGGIAAAYVAGKKKDPYYLLTAGTGLITAPLMGLTVVGLKEFTPIANLVYDEYMLTVNAASKFRSLKEVIAEAKANPKKVTMGGTSLGGNDSICTYLIEKAAGIQLNYVVFQGGGEVNAALLGNHVDMAVSNPGEALELYRAGKVRILGVFSEKRLSGAPDVPTLKEQGLNATFVQNRGVAAPADIPADARNVLEQAFLKYTQTETFKKYCRDNMLTEAWLDGKDFGKFLDELNARYAVILKDMGMLKKK